MLDDQLLPVSTSSHHIATVVADDCAACVSEVSASLHPIAQACFWALVPETELDAAEQPEVMFLRYAPEYAVLT